MSYDPRNINQMYEQYSKTHSSKPVTFNKSPLDDDTSSSFDQFTRRETTRGLGSPTKPDDDNKQEDTGGVKGFFSRMFNLLDTSGAKKSTPIDYEGSSVYNRKEFDIKPTPVSVSELDDAPQGYDPLGINTRDFGKGVDTFNTDTDPKIPQTAMIDIGNPNKEDVNRGTSSRLAKAAAVSAGLMTPALPGMADAVNRTLSSLRMDSTDVPYVIQAGDTLSDIAAKTGTTVNDLVKANDIKNKNKIYTGEELVIPTEKTTMTKDDVVSAIIKGYERDKDMSGVQVASADPDAPFYESFRQGITPKDFKYKDTSRRLVDDLMKDFDLTKVQASAIVGNLAQETGEFKFLQEKKPTVKGSKGGYGFAQWTGPRRKAYENWAEENGLDVNTYEANYGYLKEELENKQKGTIESMGIKTIENLKKMDDIEDATQYVSEYFLRPGIPHMNKRKDYAKEILEMAD